MTIDQIKTAADTNIRVKTADNSVTRDEVADLFDNLADEQRDRGIFGVDTTAGLTAISGANYRKVAVGDTGIFEWASTGTANGTTIFAASGGGVWILKMAIPKGALASLNSIDYTTNLITNKPDLGSIAALNSIDYSSGQITNKPDLTLKADLVAGKVPADQLPSYIDDVLEYANLAALPGTGEAGKIYITVDNNSTYRWSGSQYLLLVSGGGGGSQSLDSVLAVGNVTDTGIVFDPNTYATNYEFIKVNPIDTFSSQVPFRMTRWNVPQNSGAVAGNEGLMFGFNLTSGGGAIESGKPAIGFSIETNYLPDYSTRYVEWHDLYIPSVTANGLTAGIQVRLSSYTINTAINSIDLYRRVGREYLMNPFDDVQYWLVQPGSFGVKDGAGNVSTAVSSEYQAAHSGIVNLTRIAGGNMDKLVIQGYPIVSFEGANLQNFTMPANLTFSNPILTNGLNITTEFNLKAPGLPTEYITFDPQGANHALALYGNGLNKIWAYGITELAMNFTGGNRMTNDVYGFAFEGTGEKRIWGADLTLKLGLNTSYRFSQAWVKDGHFNQMAVQSKSSDPTTSDVEDGMWMVWKNTTTGNTYLYMNDGGTMKSVQLS